MKYPLLPLDGQSMKKIITIVKLLKQAYFSFLKEDKNVSKGKSVFKGKCEL